MHREGLQSGIHVMGSKAFWIEEREWEQFEMVLDIIKRFLSQSSELLSDEATHPPRFQGAAS